MMLVDEAEDVSRARTISTMRRMPACVPVMISALPASLALNSAPDGSSEVRFCVNWAAVM